jgi:FixJ family two-component response regulator
MSTIIYVVDDDLPFLTAISRLLRVAGYEVAAYQSARELLEHLPDDNTPGCILLDVRIPGQSGPELQDRLNRLGSLLPVIFLTGYGDIQTSVQAIKAGAEDFLTKPVSRDKLLDSIEGALARHKQMREKRGKLEALRDRVNLLTPRERQVFEQVVRGRMNKQIAHELGATERTIKAHRQRIMEKIDVQSVAELVLVAERAGILAPAASQQDGRRDGSQ